MAFLKSRGNWGLVDCFVKKVMRGCVRRVAKFKTDGIKVGVCRRSEKDFVGG